jgi:hypothetical protein
MRSEREMSGEQRDRRDQGRVPKPSRVDTGRVARFRRQGRKVDARLR